MARIACVQVLLTLGRLGGVILHGGEGTSGRIANDGYQIWMLPLNLGISRNLVIHRTLSIQSATAPPNLPGFARSGSGFLAGRSGVLINLY
jgi:hypothetical protein